MGGSSKPSTTTSQTQSRVDIPEFLRPYLQNQINAGGGALTSLQGQLQNAGADQLVAGFTPDQMQGRDIARSFVTDPSGQLATAKNVLGDFAGGAAIQRYSPQVLDALGQGMGASFDTSGLQNFAQNPAGMGDAAQNALTQSAAGGFMYGNPAFDEAVQASIRAARPSILSGFASQGGAGAAKGGLAQIGLQQAASDSFARLFGDERNRQIQASGQLGDFSLGARNLQQDAANQNIQAQLQQQQLRNQASQAFGGILSDERGRQLNAAGQLPGIGLLGADVMQKLGLDEQQLNQLRLMAPIQAQQMLLGAASGSPQFASLFGESGSASGTEPIYRNKAGGALGGALAGAQLGSIVPGIGTGIGAAAGGILGLLG